MSKICKDCQKHHNHHHIFYEPTDFELHAELALTAIYSEDDISKLLIDELLYTLDQLDPNDKNHFMQETLNDFENEYKAYKVQNRICDNVNGCYIIHQNKYKDISREEIEKYANIFYNL